MPIVMCDECDDAPATQKREDEDGNLMDVCDDCAEDLDDEQSNNDEDDDGA